MLTAAMDWASDQLWSRSETRTFASVRGRLH
jgi:hypothetical protein